MKGVGKMRIKLITFVLIVVLAGLAMSSAAAQAEKEKFTLVACEIQQLDPGTAWVSGDNIFHFRNQIVVHQVYSDEPLLQGLNTVTRSGDINLKTGKGHIFGSSVHRINGVEGAWVGRFTIQVEPDAPYWGSGTSQGTGELAGMTQKIEFGPLPPDVTDYPCEDAATTGMHTAYLIRHGR
jgi:hypothetical protein